MGFDGTSPSDVVSAQIKSQVETRAQTVVPSPVEARRLHLRTMLLQRLLWP
jgi:hypothetical protein